MLDTFILRYMLHETIDSSHQHIHLRERDFACIIFKIYTIEHKLKGKEYFEPHTKIYTVLTRPLASKIHTQLSIAYEMDFSSLNMFSQSSRLDSSVR